MRELWGYTEKECSSRGNSKCKGPEAAEAGVCPVCPKTSKKASVPGEE